MKRRGKANLNQIGARMTMSQNIALRMCAMYMESENVKWCLRSRCKVSLGFRDLSNRLTAAINAEPMMLNVRNIEDILHCGKNASAARVGSGSRTLR